MKIFPFCARLALLASASFFLHPVRAEESAASTIFLRSSETDAKLSAIQTGSVEFHPATGTGPGVWRVSVGHLGTPEYYEAIQKRLDGMTVVLFEGVGRDEQVKKGPGAVDRDAGIQK